MIDPMHDVCSFLQRIYVASFSRSLTYSRSYYMGLYFFFLCPDSLAIFFPRLCIMISQSIHDFPHAFLFASAILQCIFWADVTILLGSMY